MSTTLTLELEPGSLTPIKIRMDGTTHALRKTFSATDAAELGADLMLLAAAFGPSYVNVSGKVGSRLHDAITRIRATALALDVAGMTLKADDHAAEAMFSPSASTHAGRCRCGWETRPYTREANARAALCQHLLNPEGPTTDE